MLETPYRYPHPTANHINYVDRELSTSSPVEVDSLLYMHSVLCCTYPGCTVFVHLLVLSAGEMTTLYRKKFLSLLCFKKKKQKNSCTLLSTFSKNWPPSKICHSKPPRLRWLLKKYGAAYSVHLFVLFVCLDCCGF